MHKNKTLTFAEAYLENPSEIVKIKQFQLCTIPTRFTNTKGENENKKYSQDFSFIKGYKTVQNECLQKSST